jgi:exodeoxyribonuclease V gamma subunit
MRDGATAEVAAAIARERGRLPHGAIGESVFHACLGDVLPVADAVRSAARRGGLPPLTYAVEVGGIVVRGTLQGRHAGGLVLGLPHERRARHRLDAWLAHLVFHLADPAREHVTQQHALGGCIDLLPVDDAQEQLAVLVSMWRDAVERPLPFFPEASSAYAGSVAKGRVEALRSAWRKFAPEGDGDRGYPERDDPYVELAWRGVESPLGEEFEHMAQLVFAPLLAHTEERQ